MRRALALTLFLAAPAWGQTPDCDSLEGPTKDLAKQVLDSVKPYDCCSDTVTACLAAKPRCKVAVRIANDVCRLARIGKDREAIEREFGRRSKSMSGQGTAQLTLDPATLAGDSKAPVTLVVYACSRCPYCKVVTQQLHREVTEGGLKGRAKLYLRPFPIKSHEDAVDGDLALMAAAKLDRFWPYTLLQYENFEQFSPKVLPDWAASAGMDRDAFAKAVADPATKDALTESKKEGVRNRVNATPTLFIDGKQYQYDLGIGVIADLVGEEYDRLTEPRASP